MINSFSTVCLAELRIEKHKLIIIAQDGENVKPKPVDKIVSSTGLIKFKLLFQICDLFN